MKIKNPFNLILVAACTVIGGLALVAVTWAAPWNAPLAQGGAPPVVAYQGEVRVSDAPYTGAGYFKFAVVDAAGTTTYWSNDGTSTGGGAPTAAVGLAVSEGLFGLLLGDTTLGGMTQALAADVFGQPDRYLRVWFSDDGSAFGQLTPDTRIAAVPYALQAQEAADADTVDGYEGTALEESAEIDADIAAHTAITDAHHARYADGEAWAAILANDGSGSGLNADTVDGQHASELGTHYQNVVIVAKSGGDYSGVQAAINSITGAAADNPYLVWVAPGVYVEQVTMKPYVHLQGAGREATVITSTAGSVWPPTQATLILTSDASLRDLTVGNGGTGERNVALLATAGMTRTLVADVTAQAQGGGTYNYAILLSGSGTGITLQQVSALAENGSSSNYGLYNRDGAAVLQGGSFTGRGGGSAYGIYNRSNGTTLETESITALGEDGTGSNHGLYNGYGAAATLRGGSFTARGGTDTRGIYNTSSVTMLEAESITVLGEDGTSGNYGLYNREGAAVTLRGGSFTARGGAYAYGIYNDSSATTLEAESVTALGEDGSNNNYGLYNFSGAAATLRGGSFTARGGATTRGVYNWGSTNTLEAESITVLGENSSGYNYGLYNQGAAATLRGGSFTARGGTDTWGIYNTGSGPTLEAESVTALGENGSSNYGLRNSSSATTNVTQSVLEGATNSVYLSSGTVTVSNSRLVGGAVDGTVTCVLVTRGTTVSTDGATCP